MHGSQERASSVLDAGVECADDSLLENGNGFMMMIVVVGFYVMIT